MLLRIILYFSLYIFFLGTITRASPRAFVEVARNVTAPYFIDKISFTHAYSVMYGMFLMPKVDEIHKLGMRVKMLEIGLGCWDNFATVKSDVKKSAHIWNEILAPNDDLYIAEFNEPCAHDWYGRGILPRRVKLLLGDQSDPTTLKRWIIESHGANFDIVIDDGGHSNIQILTSFDYLWPRLNPGGLYFIEDVQVGRRKDKEDSGGKRIINDVLKDWIEQLMIPRRLKGWTHKIPPDIRWIMCQNHACVLQKCEVDDVAHCSGAPVRPRHQPRT
jgi:hypothetical protein